MEVLVHSQPNKLFTTKMNTVAQMINANPLMKRVASSLAMPSLALPCRVQRRISSAPD